MFNRLTPKCYLIVRFVGGSLALLLLFPRAEAADYPISFNTKAVKSGGRNIRINNGTTFTEIAVTGKSVEVDIQSSDQPSSPYLIECFFVARYEGDKKEWIYDVALKESTDQFDKFFLKSEPLRGKQTSESHMQVRFTDGSRGTFITEEAIAGDRVSGWIVRCRSKGKIVATRASSRPLLEFAEKNTQLLDEVLLDFYPDTKSGADATRTPSGINLPTPERLWRSAGGKKIFGKVTAINLVSGTITLVRSDGVKFEAFEISNLHPEDQKLLLVDKTDK